MEADGSDPVQLTDPPEGLFDTNPSWSADGTRIAFLSTRDGSFDIFVADADGGNPLNLTRSPHIDTNPSWSPDGTMLAFWSPTRTGGLDAFTMKTDGSDLAQVTRGGANVVPRWLPQTDSPPVVELDLEATPTSYEGRTAVELRAEQAWVTTYTATDPVALPGYASLDFAFHPGEATVPEERWFKVQINQQQVDLLGEGGVEVERREWQDVKVPMDAFGPAGEASLIRFQSNLRGTFYLVDIRMVAARPGPGTAVLETRDPETPTVLALSQNYPNPFNPETTIRFDLPQPTEIELVIHNLAAQKVVTLVQGNRPAGSYSLRWDGRDDHGRELASGVYLYRLSTADGITTRKLLLLR